MEPWYNHEEIQAVTDYLNSGGWIMEFSKTKELEEMIADYTGAKYCSLLPNGTLSLWAALAVLGIGIGDEVIVPDFTMVATPNAVLLAGVSPVFVDVDRNDLSLDFELTKKAINKNTKAIMLVSINGRCPRVKDFVKLAQDNNIYLIEDAAQSLGSFVDGKHLGSFGIIGSFSFSMPKIITMGQGGALITDDENIYKKIIKFKDFGREKAGSDNYESLGYNLKFTDLQAVFGIEQMKKLPIRVKRKKEIFSLYKKLLSDNKNIELLETSKETSPWFIDVIVEKRDELITFLKEHGIATRAFYPSLHTLSFYGVKKEYPISSLISKKGLWLPSSSNLSNEDIAYTCDKIGSFYK